jgi:hypothetical protein
MTSNYRSTPVSYAARRAKSTAGPSQHVCSASSRRPTRISSSDADQRPASLAYKGFGLAPIPARTLRNTD